MFQIGIHAWKVAYTSGEAAAGYVEWSKASEAAKPIGRVELATSQRSGGTLLDIALGRQIEAS